MNGKCASHMESTSYLAVYQQYYAPRFMAIDVALKTMEAPFTVEETALLLDMKEDCVRHIMAQTSVAWLDKNGFLTVMRNGESPVCLLYKRELSRSIKEVYDPSDIAYIYDLQERHVTDVCKKIGLTKMPACDVPKILEKISVFILY